TPPPTTPRTTTTETTGKKAERKIRDEEQQKKIADKWAKFKKGGGSITANGLDPKRMEAAVELIAEYIKSGVYKFSDIVEDSYAMMGEELKGYFNALKAAYSAYFNTEATDDEANQMDSNIRSV